MLEGNPTTQELNVICSYIPQQQRAVIIQSLCSSMLFPNMSRPCFLNPRDIWYEDLWVLQDPDEAVVEVGVDGFHIIQSDRFAEQLFVEGQREASVDVMAVEHCHAHDATHKMEVRQVLLQH